MPIDADISTWIERLQQGDSRAAQVIWENYFDKLAAVARQKLAAVPRRMADEEDVALSAMHSFYRGVAAKRFPKLDDRHDLWKVLVTITARKAIAAQRRHYSQKRGAGKVRGEPVFGARAADESQGGGIDEVLGQAPTPELAVALAERCGELLGTLDERQRSVALLKMEGYNNQEIAEQLDIALRSVERRLEQIRGLWLSHIEGRQSA